ncbi:MAG: hypothetical protein Fur0025_09790 [Oscillatoriaceae cyanobacterium]
MGGVGSRYCHHNISNGLGANRPKIFTMTDNGTHPMVTIADRKLTVRWGGSHTEPKYQLH